MKFILTQISLLLVGITAIGQSTFINEVNYLTTDQCIEIAKLQNTSIDGWTLHRYDEQGFLEDSQPADGVISSSNSGYDFIIVDVVIYMQDNSGLGFTDSDGQVIQFLSFGSDIVAQNGPLQGSASENIGMQVSEANSLQLTGSGSEYTDFEWTTAFAASCGSINPDQEFTLPQNSLPIELAYFKCTTSGRNVLISWATLSEINNDYFLLEKSDDAKNWSILAHVPAQVLSTADNEYGYTDHQPLTGRSYYRLSQFDLDGTITVFDIVAVQLFEKEDINIFPNPGNDLINIVLVDGDAYQDLQIHVTNLLGESMNVHTSAPGILDISSLEAGVYYIRIYSAGNEYKAVFTKL